MTDRVDTVIVGGGTAGCVLANRLSSNPAHRVALLEAGPDFGPVAEGRWPAELIGGAYVESEYDWGYEVIVHGQRLRYTRGRVIGGSSAVNATGINWGLRRDYDAWAAAGNPGWGFDDLAPYFRLVERFEGDGLPERSRDGMLPVTASEATSPFLESLKEAYEAAGLRPADIGGPDALEGYGVTTRNQRNGRRIHAAEAYLDPVRNRSNLTIVDHALVDRLEWRDGRVTGVRYRRNGEERTIEAGRVVLAAGTIGDPLILQRSGIGPEERLRVLLPRGSAIHPLAGVGRNLHDHFGTRAFYRPSLQFYQLLAERNPDLPPDGRFALAARVRSARSLDAYDLNIGITHTARPTRHSNPLAPLPDVISAIIFLVHLKGTGSVEISGPDPSDPPIIDPGIGDNDDIEAVARGVEWVRSRFAHRSMWEWIGLEELPGPAVNGPSIRAWVRNHLALYHHPTGTCKMGPASDPTAVVDHTGKVHGFDNLYVADAAIMPSIPRGMIVLTVYAIAEKIAAGLAA
ncbi:MAG: putative glucose-methanol-choline oxidoreductase [Dehalococcoidia bacterium]|nr:MAG: putative glucose-methanol-choline oxidoreductase [Dehalococcoidia bacterium]